MTHPKAARSFKHLVAISFDNTIGYKILDKQYQEEIEKDFYRLSLPLPNYDDRTLQNSISETTEIAMKYLGPSTLFQIIKDSKIREKGNNIARVYIFKDMIATAISHEALQEKHEDTRKRVLKESYCIPNPNIVKTLSAEHPWTVTILASENNSIMEPVLEEMLGMTGNVVIKPSGLLLSYLSGLKNNRISYQNILWLGGNTDLAAEAKEIGIWAPENTEQFELGPNSSPQLPNYEAFDEAYKAFQKIDAFNQDEGYTLRF